MAVSNFSKEKSSPIKFSLERILSKDSELTQTSETFPDKKTFSAISPEKNPGLLPSASNSTSLFAEQLRHIDEKSSKIVEKSKLSPIQSKLPNFTDFSSKNTLINVNNNNGELFKETGFGFPSAKPNNNLDNYNNLISLNLLQAQILNNQKAAASAATLSKSPFLSGSNSQQPFVNSPFLQQPTGNILANYAQIHQYNNQLKMMQNLMFQRNLQQSLTTAQNTFKFKAEHFNFNQEYLKFPTADLNYNYPIIATNPEKILSNSKKRPFGSIVPSSTIPAGVGKHGFDEHVESSQFGSQSTAVGCASGKRKFPKMSPKSGNGGNSSAAGRFLQEIFGKN